MRANFVKKITIISALCVMTTACADVKYMSRSSLQGSSIASQHDNYAIKKPRTFGAIAFGGSEIENEDPTVFLFKRKKSYYMAETLLFNQSDDDKAVFDKTYLSFGADKKKKFLGLNLRFIY